MYRELDDFFQLHSFLTDGTKKVFANLKDKNLNQSVAEGHRTLGQIAWHVVTTIPEMMSKTGLTVSSVDPGSMPPSSAKEIMDAYEKVTNELTEAIEAGWDDDTLFETDDMFGEEWPRGMTLTALIHHEIHHVGQMTILLRQAGAKVPGLFGPAKEEWAAMGLETPPY